MSDPQSARALVLALIAGLSTLLGACVIFFSRAKSEKLLSASLGFAAGVMISVSTIDLYPHARALFVRGHDVRVATLLAVGYLALGLCAAFALDFFVPHDAFDEKTGAVPHKDLFRVGFISTMAIALHNFPEGIATFMAGYDDLALGASIALAISMHNVPEGISVAMPIYYATGSRRKAFLYALYAALAEPIGGLIAFSLLRPFISDMLMGAVFASISGIMIYISIEELIPSSRQYGFARIGLFATLVGFCLMPLSHVLF